MITEKTQLYEEEQKKKKEKRTISNIFSLLPSNIYRWQAELGKLLKEYESYIPECDNLARCEHIITTRYDAIRGWKKRDNADILLNSNDKLKSTYNKSLQDFEEKLFKLKEEKIEEYRNKYSKEEELKGEELKEQHPILIKYLNEYKLYEPECDNLDRCEYIINTRFEALIGFLIRGLAIDKRNLDIYLNKMKKIKNEKIEEYRNKYSKEEEIIIKINRWKDKIIELIVKFTKSKIECDTIKECNEIIEIINDIIHSFIIRPNTMTEIIPESYSTSKNIYNYRKYRIFNKYLKDYKIKLNENDLINSEFINSQKEFIEILKITTAKKIDDCKNK